MRRLRVIGPNAVRSHRVRVLSVLASQLRSPLLLLLAATAIASAFLGKRSDAVIIGMILLASVGLGFANEYKAAKTAEALHSSIHHRCVVLRDGHPRTTDVTETVPGDVVDLQLGEVVPADLRLLATAGLECDESVLTGESLPAEKSAGPVAAGTPLAELRCCALMGTVVQAGSGVGVVVATGKDAEFGRIAVGLGERQPETEFQVGLRKFSMLLVQVAGVLTGAIFIINVALHKPVLDTLRFSLAIAVGISPQLLPAVVSTSLAAGSRQLARGRSRPCRSWRGWPLARYPVRRIRTSATTAPCCRTKTGLRSSSAISGMSSTMVLTRRPQPSRRPPGFLADVRRLRLDAGHSDNLHRMD